MRAGRRHGRSIVPRRGRVWRPRRPVAPIVGAVRGG